MGQFYIEMQHVCCLWLKLITDVVCYWNEKLSRGTCYTIHCHVPLYLLS